MGFRSRYTIGLLLGSAFQAPDKGADGSPMSVSLFEDHQLVTTLPDLSFPHCLMANWHLPLPQQGGD